MLLEIFSYPIVTIDIVILLLLFFFYGRSNPSLTNTVGGLDAIVLFCLH